MLGIARLTARTKLSAEDVLAARLLAIALESWLLAAGALDSLVNDDDMDCGSLHSCTHGSFLGACATLTVTTAAGARHCGRYGRHVDLMYEVFEVGAGANMALERIC